MSANPLVARVEDFIRGSRSDSFDALAVAIFKDQTRRCPLWANLAAHRGIDPDPGVARCGEYLGVPLKRTHQGVFTGTGSDHENSHDRRA